MNAKDMICLALDVDNLSDMTRLVQTLGPKVGYCKIGLEAITSMGAPIAVDCVHANGGRSFFDGKFDDIPNTVARAAMAVARMGVAMFNVHASAGPKSIRAAVENKGNSLVLGVTVLTSINDANCVSIFGDTPGKKVLDFSKMLLDAGADGIISSPEEVALLGRHGEFDDLLKVTPGVRPRWYKKGDQARIMTPADAVRAGVDIEVIGRPITAPPEEIGTPLYALQLITEEIEQAMAA